MFDLGKKCSFCLKWFCTSINLTRHGLNHSEKKFNALHVKKVLLHLGDYPDMNVAIVKKNNSSAYSVWKYLVKVVI